MSSPKGILLPQHVGEGFSSTSLTYPLKTLNSKWPMNKEEEARIEEGGVPGLEVGATGRNEHVVRVPVDAAE